MRQIWGEKKMEERKTMLAGKQMNKKQKATYIPV